MGKKKDSVKIKQEISDFFKDIDNRTPKDIKKIKRKAMSINFKLGKLRKKFCKRCYTVLKGNSITRIKDGIKIVRCKNCGQIGRWKMV